MIRHELRVRGRSRGFAVDDDVDLDLDSSVALDGSEAIHGRRSRTPW